MSDAPGPVPTHVDERDHVWEMLLNGYGFNWYRSDNLLRADDLLIRSRASEHLAAAAGHLRDAESGYRRRHIPPPTREHPDPDPARLAEARRLREAAERIAVLDTRLRGASVPPDDKIWSRFRGRQEDLLLKLCQADMALVGGAHDLAALCAGVGADGLSDATEQAIGERLAAIAAALDQRGTLLAIPGG